MVDIHKVSSDGPTLAYPHADIDLGAFHMLIAQLSDPHIRPEGALYQGVVDSNRMFSEALTHLFALDKQPEVLLITGDLVDEGRPEEYAMVRELLSTLRVPFLVIPGNHDHRENFRAAIRDQPYLPADGPLERHTLHGYLPLHGSAATGEGRTGCT